MTSLTVLCVKAKHLTNECNFLKRMAIIGSQANVAQDILQKENIEGELLPDIKTHSNATIILTFPCYRGKNGQLTPTG